MILEDFKKMKAGGKVLTVTGEVRCFVGVINDCVVSTSLDGTNACSWRNLSLAALRIYIEPKAKTKFYLYCREDGKVSEYFYSKDRRLRFTGKDASCSSPQTLGVWERTNTFIEVEI